MAKLNLEKAIKEGYKQMNDRYCMKLSQANELAKRSKYDMIADSFAFGYIQGVKATKAETRKGSACA